MINPIIKYYLNGNKSSEYYCLNDKLHNDNGPAEILYYENGNKQLEVYYINDLCHNTNGPAYIRYHKNGNKEFEYYYLNDIHLEDINSLKQLQRYIKLYNIS